MNLTEKLHRQIDRARELASLYDALPEESGFGTACMIRLRIEAAERSFQSGKISEIAAAHNALEALQ